MRRSHPAPSFPQDRRGTDHFTDILEANGFDERMNYGGLDRELGERLQNRGIQGRSIRFEAICLHQFHERPYATAAGIAANQAIRAEVQRKGISRTPFGIVKEA